jgi:hypothetical protein
MWTIHLLRNRTVLFVANREQMNSTLAVKHCCWHDSANMMLQIPYFFKRDEVGYRDFPYTKFKLILFLTQPNQNIYREDLPKTLYSHNDVYTNQSLDFKVIRPRKKVKKLIPSPSFA